MQQFIDLSHNGFGLEQEYGSLIILMASLYD